MHNNQKAVAAKVKIHATEFCLNCDVKTIKQGPGVHVR
uniref:Uncharacterized protein n=1 Tax=Rhizophora mucronata TaxID=61149 RepID=A0A2P2Q5U6_RHIMU